VGVIALVRVHDRSSRRHHRGDEEDGAMRESETDRPRGSADLVQAEKLACEREARHDVAARGRRAEPAAALQRYVTHLRIEEERLHADHLAHRSHAPVDRCARPGDDFAAEHPLAASWLRWGEDPR
jgi:hypothetical protein